MLSGAGSGSTERRSTAESRGLTTPSTGTTTPVMTGAMISVTTERGRLTPEQALTTDSCA